MRIEVQNIPTAPRQKFQQRIRNYATDLDNAKAALRKAHADSERVALFGNRANDMSNQDAVLDQRQQLLSGTDRLERSSARLQNATRLANDTENVGAGILGSLAGQRAQIENTRSTLLEGEDYVNKSVNTLRGMARRYVSLFFSSTFFSNISSLLSPHPSSDILLHEKHLYNTLSLTNKIFLVLEWLQIVSSPLRSSQFWYY